MKVLITGAAGFIGSHLAEAMLAQGHDVVGIDNLTTGRRDNFPGHKAQLVVGDIRDSVPDEDWDVIYHCAASYKDRDDWERDASTNVDGTIKVIRTAKRVGAKLIYFQTSLCYGPNPTSPVAIGAPLDPRGSYPVSKTAGEAFIRDSGLDYVSLRLANIYGPRNLSGPIPAFYQRLTEGKPCTVVRSRRDFVYVDDLVEVAVQAAEAGVGPYHVSSGSDSSILQVYLAVCDAMDIGAPEPFVDERGPDDVATLLLDPSRTIDEFGWTAKTQLSDGVAKAVEWYREHGVTETYTHLKLKG